MNLGDLVLREINQTENEKKSHLLFVEFKRMKSIKIYVLKKKAVV